MQVPPTTPRPTSAGPTAPAVEGEIASHDSDTADDPLYEIESVDDIDHRHRGARPFLNVHIP